MLRGDPRALSEIVGALFLVLIVVSAAAAFAVFLNDRQQIQQEQQLFEARRALESVRVLGLVPTVNVSDPGRWDGLNFSLGSLHAAPSVITTIRVNDHVVRQFDVWRLNVSSGSRALSTLTYSSTFAIDAREQLNLVLNATTSFFESGLTFSPTSFLRIELVSDLQNEFNRTFLAPSAIPYVATEDVWNGTAFTPILVLDGSRSDHPGDGSIVSWAWRLDPDASNATGRRVKAAFNVTGVEHNITLTVTDNFGFVGSDVIRYFY